MSNRKKKRDNETFKKAMIIYSVVLIVLILIVNSYVYIKLADYEKLTGGEKAQNNQQALIPVSTPTVVPGYTPGTEGTGSNEPVNTPTPTPVPMDVVSFKIPEGLDVYVNGEAIDLSNVEVNYVHGDDFAVLYDFAERYSEYKNIEADAKIPRLLEFSLEVKPGAEVGVYTKDLKTVSTEYDEDTHTYSAYFLSDESEQEEIVKFAFEAQKNYSLFCAEDLDRSDIAKYFPSNSEYYKSITTLDIWYTKHDGLPKYTDQKVNFYNKYSENLYCADVSVVETIKARANGENISVKIRHKIWIYRIDGKLKIAAMEF